MWSILSRTAKPGRWPAPLRCSFCGRDENHVARLVAGAAAHICDDCIGTCVTVLQRHGGLDMPPANRTE
jgi:ATP-dependent Clp protease ATP-binding subunit ClpX